MSNRFLGDKAFYRRVIAIAIPIIIQNSITQFVQLLDNIMVGQVGTLEMSGVSIANQLILIFNLCVFGANSGAGIFTAQFYGSKNHDGIRYTIRYKILVCTLLSILGVGVLFFFGEDLIQTFLQGEGQPEDARQILGFSFEYMKIMFLGFLPFAISNAYSCTLRECDRTTLPMVGGITAVLTNLALNYVLIFGHFGAPKMGVNGAAVATVISRYVELLVVVLWSHCRKQQYPFLKGVYRSLRIPLKLAKHITRKGMPLMINECFWSTGIALIAQSYSTCGLEVVPAINIADTINNFSNVINFALGSTVAIIMGQMMGAGEEKKDIQIANTRLAVLAVVFGVIFAALLSAVSGLFPLLYNTTDSVRSLATSLILISAFMKPFQAYAYSGYYTLRSGGKSLLTMVYDSGLLWALTLPLAFCLSQFTDLPIIPLYAICQSCDLVKTVLCYFLVRKGTWIQNLTQ